MCHPAPNLSGCKEDLPSWYQQSGLFGAGEYQTGHRRKARRYRAARARPARCHRVSRSPGVGRGFDLSGRAGPVRIERRSAWVQALNTISNTGLTREYRGGVADGTKAHSRSLLSASVPEIAARHGAGPRSGSRSRRWSRQTRVPQSLFNGHLTASNSDARSRYNARWHERPTWRIRVAWCTDRASSCVDRRSRLTADLRRDFGRPPKGAVRVATFDRGNQRQVVNTSVNLPIFCFPFAARSLHSARPSVITR